MPISPDTALGLLASFTVATWALAWLAHESARQSMRSLQGRIRGPVRAGGRAVRRASGRLRAAHGRGHRERYPAASRSSHPVSPQGSPLQPVELEGVAAPMPSPAGARGPLPRSEAPGPQPVP